MGEEKSTTHKRGELIGAVIGAVFVSLLSSGALSGWLNQDVKKDAAATAEVKAREQAALAEEAVANYIEREVEPKVTKAFADVAQDISDMDQELMTCQRDAREALVLADAALRLAERRVGTQAVERAVSAAEPPRPAPTADKKREIRVPEFSGYEQRIVVEELE